MTLKAGEMNKHMDMSELVKGQIVMTRWLSEKLKECLEWSVYIKSGHMDAHGEWMLAHVIGSNRQVIVAQIAEEIIAGSERMLRLFKSKITSGQ